MRKQFQDVQSMFFFSPAIVRLVFTTFSWTSEVWGETTPQPMSHPATRRIARSDRTIKRDDKPMAERRMMVESKTSRVHQINLEKC